MFVLIINQKFFNMKRLVLVFLIAALSIPAFQACKKGENDPSISLKSRKARLLGEWKLTAGAITENNGSTITNFTYNGSTVVVSGSVNGSWAYTQSVKFNKDGSFVLTVFEDGDQSVFDGNWYFLSANKEEDLKEKEAISLYYKKITETPAGGTPSVIMVEGFANLGYYNGIGATYKIDKLSSKEIILLVDYVLTTSSTMSRKGTLTFTK